MVCEILRELGDVAPVDREIALPEQGNGLFDGKDRSIGLSAEDLDDTLPTAVGHETSIGVRTSHEITLMHLLKESLRAVDAGGDLAVENVTDS